MNKTDKEQFEATCNAFIDSVNNYFLRLTKNPSETGIPYLKDQNALLLRDFTGMIGISGNKKGFVYISGNRKMYTELLKSFIGLDDPAEEDILDMAGEVSNVVAGNMRETYGSEFMISVPIVFKGKPDRLKFPKDVAVYVIPIEWRGQEAIVVIAIS